MWPAFLPRRLGFTQPNARFCCNAAPRSLCYDWTPAALSAATTRSAAGIEVRDDGELQSPKACSREFKPGDVLVALVNAGKDTDGVVQRPSLSP